MKRLLILLFVLTAMCLSVQAQKKKRDKKSDATEQAKPKSTSKIKPYNEVITQEAKTDQGLFTTHKVNEEYFFEIPDSLLEREILIISRISGTIENFNFGGAGMKARGQQVWRWQKKDNVILLRSVSFDNVASPDEPIYNSVRNNNFEPIVKTFDIKAFGKDSSSYVIDVNELFTTDVPMISPMSDNQRKEFQVKGLDKSRSLIEEMKSFPLNTEVRHILTYNAGKAPSNGTVGSISIEMNQSLVLLPKVPMQPRLNDDRVGYFSVTQTNYGLDEQKAAKKSYITRWKLVPKDMEAYKRGDLVEPVKPIVYYIDPATPVKWRKYIKEGVEAWQIAFEKAGFKNAILAKDPPSKEEDPDWSTEDVRYSVIRYTANPIQNAQGPNVHDPRSGEIIQSDIIWYHNVMNLLRNWYFIQTSAVNELARKTKFDDDVMGKLLTFVATHEVGHTLGLPHNMGSSYAYPVDSLRSATFTKKMGTAPSIMDYARFNYIAQPGDSAALQPNIGTYDKWAIKWGYTVLPDASSPEQEKDTLNKWIRSHENDPLYWYGPQGNPGDPRAQTEDLGNDAMKASDYGIANLKRIIPKLMEWATEPGKNYDELEELYGQIMSQWNRYNGHVLSNIGGLYQTFKTTDQEGPVYEFIPKETQKRAMIWLQKNTFTTPYWMVEKDVVHRFEGVGLVDKIRNYQADILNNLLDPGRISRFLEAESMDGDETYTAIDMFSDLRNGIWSEIKTGKTIDIYRRNLQRAYLERMAKLMSEDKNENNYSRYRSGSIDLNQSDIKALVRAELNILKGQLPGAISKTKDTMSSYHLRDVEKRIETILDPDAEH